MTKAEALKQLELMREATKGASWEKVLDYAIEIVRSYADEKEPEQRD